MTDWYIGCSGFYYKHWKGTFYPKELPQKNWFEYYCKFFNTLELNVTFYRFPELSFLENWYQKSPENFRFAVKAPRIITHYKQFINAAEQITAFYDVVNQGLKEKLGCVLFQMPPRFSYTEERLKRLLLSLDSSFPNVVEFRHESWWQPEIYKKLAEHNISFCGMSHPTLPKEVVKNTPLLYYRMHGKGQLYASNYNSNQIEELVREIEADKPPAHAYIYFNNDIHTYAVYNAMDMKKMTEKSS